MDNLAAIITAIFGGIAILVTAVMTAFVSFKQIPQVHKLVNSSASKAEERIVRMETTISEMRLANAILAESAILAATKSTEAAAAVAVKSTEAAAAVAALAAAHTGALTALAVGDQLPPGVRVP